MEWLPVFANYRRDGYDFDALYEDGKAPLKHKKIIFNNTSRCFEGEPAYDLYVNWMCGGVDPQQEDSQTERMHRLANGTDETSITYL